MNYFDNLKATNGLSEFKPFGLLNSIKWRAEAMLKGTPLDHLERVAEQVEWAIGAFKQDETESELDRYAERLDRMGGWELQYLENSEDPEHITTVSEIRELLEFWPRWASDKPDVPTGNDFTDLEALRELLNLDSSHLISPTSPLPSQCQLYALLALMKIDQAVGLLLITERETADGTPIHSGPNQWKVADTIIAGNLLIESMEIVCWAERELSHDELTQSRLKEKELRTVRDKAELEGKEKLARSAHGRALAAKRWETLKPARERAKLFIGEALDDWRRAPQKYANQGEFARAMADKIEFDEDGCPVYSASSIQVKIIPLLRKAKC